MAGTNALAYLATKKNVLYHGHEVVRNLVAPVGEEVRLAVLGLHPHGDLQGVNVIQKIPLSLTTKPNKLECF